MAERVYGNYYDLPIGSYCGVIIDEELNKKLLKLLTKQKDELLQFLACHQEHIIGNSGWTLGRDTNNKQVILNYISNYEWEDAPFERLKRLSPTLVKSHRIEYLYSVTKDEDPYETVKEAFESVYGMDTAKEGSTLLYDTEKNR